MSRSLVDADGAGGRDVQGHRHSSAFVGFLDPCGGIAASTLVLPTVVGSHSVWPERPLTRVRRLYTCRWYDHVLRASLLQCCLEFLEFESGMTRIPGAEPGCEVKGVKL